MKWNNEGEVSVNPADAAPGKLDEAKPIIVCVEPIILQCLGHWYESPIEIQTPQQSFKKHRPVWVCENPWCIFSIFVR